MTSSAANQFPVSDDGIWLLNGRQHSGREPTQAAWQAISLRGKAGWMIWVLAGSYYIRSGTQDYEEGWGLLKHDWSDWRSPSYVNGQLLKMVKETPSPNRA